MYKKLLVLAALMSAVCFTAVAHETLNTQGSYHVAKAQEFMVTVRGTVDKKPVEKNIRLTDDTAAAAKESAKQLFKQLYPKATDIVVLACNPKQGVCGFN